MVKNPRMKGRRATAVRRNTRELKSTIDDLLGGPFREKRDAFPNPSLHLQHIHVRDNHKTTNMSIAKTYLLAYNASLIAGWSYVLVLAGAAFAEGGAGAVYAAVEIPLLAAQTAACLEVVHAILGIARSPVLVTAMQVSSRLMVVWGVLFISPPSRTAVLAFGEVGGVQLGLGVPSLLLCWGITEVVRYSFYFFKLLGTVPHAIVWARYTFFIVLYPLGVSSELWCAYSGFEHLVKSGALSMAMPNAYNIALHFPSIQVMFFLGYVPGFPMLYQYMLKQRKSVLAPAKAKKA